MSHHVAHTRRGTGEPLLLIHGIGHRRQAFDPVLDELAGRYDVIAIDLLGFGESGRYPEGAPFDMDYACAVIVEKLAELGVERPHVVGNSLGGAIALELAVRGQVSSVVALSPAGFFRHLGDRLQALGILVTLKLAAMAPDRMLKATSRTALGRRLVGLTLFAHPERLGADAVYGDSLALKRATAFWGIAREGARYAFRGAVSVPTTIAWGTRDRILRHGQSQRAREVLPQARHVDLPGCGHVPMIDDPATIIDLVDQTAALARRDEERRTA